MEDVTALTLLEQQIASQRPETHREQLWEIEQLLLAAETVGHIGSYEGDLATINFRFSDGMYQLLGHKPQSFIPTLDSIDSISHTEAAICIRHRI